VTAPDHVVAWRAPAGSWRVHVPGADGRGHHTRKTDPPTVALVVLRPWGWWCGGAWSGAHADANARSALSYGRRLWAGCEMALVPVRRSP